MNFSSLTLLRLTCANSLYTLQSGLYNAGFVISDRKEFSSEGGSRTARCLDRERWVENVVPWCIKRSESVVVTGRREVLIGDPNRYRGTRNAIGKCLGEAWSWSVEDTIEECCRGWAEERELKIEERLGKLPVSLGSRPVRYRGTLQVWTRSMPRKDTRSFGLEGAESRSVWLVLRWVAIEVCSGGIWRRRRTEEISKFT